MANHELYVVQGKTLDNIAGTMRAVLGVDKDAPIRFDEVASGDKTEQINADVETQTDLIAQIKTALDGKTAGSGSEIIAEIASLIDQSGVLDSTDGTATEKVERLIDKIGRYSWLKANLTSVSFAGNQNLDEVELDCSNFTSLYGCFNTCRSVNVIRLRNTQNVSNWSYAIYGCNYLETLETLDFSAVVSGTIGTHCIYAGHIKTLKLVPETIKVSITFNSSDLTDGTNGTFNSIQSIIDGLAPVETAQTLTLHKDVKAKLTEEQLATITNKNWNLA